MRKPEFVYVTYIESRTAPPPMLAIPPSALGIAALKEVYRS
jgi:hypothetical protein